MPTTPQIIPVLPATPDRADRATFSARATALFDAIKAAWQPAVDAVALATYNNAVEAANQAALATTNGAAQVTLATAQANTATTKATDAGISAGNAASSATLAQDWAIKTAGPVSGGEYSAKYYALIAQGVVATIPTGTINDATTSLTGVWSSSKVSADLSNKQATLVSGTNIKTINGVSVLGAGDIATGDVTKTGTENLTNKTLADPKIILGGTTGTAGQVPVSQGAGLPPVWGAVGGAIGDVISTANTLTAPYYLKCDGSVYLRSSYTALANKLGVLPDNSGSFTSAIRALPQSRYWSSIAYGNGIFVAIAVNTDVCATSTDGITWIQSTMPVNSNWSSVAFGNGIFVAVSGGNDTNSNVAATSADGITWTQRTMTSSAQWVSLAYGNGLFVAVSKAGASVVCTSPDGVTWTDRGLGGTSSWRSVVYGNGQFVAIAESGNYSATSPNGIDWTSRTNLPYSSNWSSVSYGNGKYVAVSSNSSNVAVSQDGVAWTGYVSALPYGSYGNFICFGNGVFIALNNYYYFYSYDGINWSPKSTGSSSNFVSMVYGKFGFVGVNYNYNNEALTVYQLGYSIGTQFATPIIPAVAGVTHYIKAS